MASGLPPALIDFAILRIGSSPFTRAAGNRNCWRNAFALRGMHQEALLPTPSSFEGFLETGQPPFDAPSRRQRRHGNQGSLAVRPGVNSSCSVANPISKLERRVQALEETIEAEEASINAPTYSESELLAFYEDVLTNAVPEINSTNKNEVELLRAAEAQEDNALFVALEQRLCETNTTQEIQPESPCRRVLIRAHEIVSRVEATRHAFAQNTSTSRQDFIPIPILSARECQALVRATVKEGDGKAAELALDIMKRTNLPLPQGSVTDILKLYSQSGNMDGADQLLARFLTESPTEDQRHLHVQTYLNGTHIGVLPTAALDLVHHYEAQNLPVSMRTYTSVITSLFSRPSSLARAQAWDMFTHMRYAAHPDPDAVLYTLMIRACASPITTKYSSQPEKALDLWTEMTVDHRITPTVGSYNAIILACARSGNKMYVNEAFRLARQMLDSHRDARGYSAFRPDHKTFCALLEGTKRIGDLGRARWILAEMVKFSPGMGEEAGHPVQVEIDEEVMMHLFHAYASYKPPFTRSATKLAHGTASKVQAADNDAQATSSNTNLALLDATATGPDNHQITEHEETPSFSYIPPQSRAEVIREARFLFARILEDQGLAGSLQQHSLPIAEQTFRGVNLSTVLVNSYLSIFYRHAPLEITRELFWKIFEDLKLSRSTRTYVEALERCTNSRQRSERETALKFARELWRQWEIIEREGYINGQALQPRLVERAHVAMIRVLAINEKLDEALSHLRAFASQYPPQALRNPSPKLPLQSTRTSLNGPRPLVRMTSAAEVPDDHVPPLMTFRDLEILHHRLIDEGRKNDIGYVKWVCKAYEWALRVRRDSAVKAKAGVNPNHGKGIVAA